MGEIVNPNRDVSIRAKEAVVDGEKYLAHRNPALTEQAFILTDIEDVVDVEDWR